MCVPLAINRYNDYHDFCEFCHANNQRFHDKQRQQMISDTIKFFAQTGANKDPV